ncbi:MAG: alpha/beta hydrolase [Candidatus Rokubacteria bacterium]|nr:alpha/beta hydrolase [Candidatus Rokubacteria bacterium]
MSVRFDASAPYEVEETDEVFAKPAGLELQARIYRPMGAAAAPLAALVDIHGGAWTRLDRTVGQHHGRGLAASGLVVVSLDFRQGPAHKHPAMAQDAAAGVRWVRAHAQRLGVDPARVGLLGQSSGGHIALLVAVQPGSFGGTPIVMPDGTTSTTGDDGVKVVLAAYPVADPLARHRFMAAHTSDPQFPNAPRLVESSTGYFGTEAMMEEASVTRVVGTGQARALPPAWIGQPESDDNVPPAIPDALVAAWEKAGGRLERVRFPGAKHGFLQQDSADTAKAVTAMRDFIGRYLMGGAS